MSGVRGLGGREAHMFGAHDRIVLTGAGAHSARHAAATIHGFGVEPGGHEMVGRAVRVWRGFHHEVTSGDSRLGRYELSTLLGGQLLKAARTIQVHGEDGDLVRAGALAEGALQPIMTPLGICLESARWYNNAHAMTMDEAGPTFTMPWGRWGGVAESLALASDYHDGQLVPHILGAVTIGFDAQRRMTLERSFHRDLPAAADTLQLHVASGWTDMDLTVVPPRDSGKQGLRLACRLLEGVIALGANPGLLDGSMG